MIACLRHCYCTKLFGLLWAGNFVLARYATAARRPWLQSFLTTTTSFVTSKTDHEDDDDVMRVLYFLTTSSQHTQHPSDRGPKTNAPTSSKITNTNPTNAPNSPFFNNTLSQTGDCREQMHQHLLCRHSRARGDLCRCLLLQHWQVSEVKMVIMIMRWWSW